jgi:hypothetical protein
MSYGNKPYEMIQSPMLATLRGAMRSDPLAAYVVLMVSDIGHESPSFERDGWQLLQILAKNGPVESVLKTSNEILLSFAQTDGITFTQSHRFNEYFGGFFSSRYRSLDVRPSHGFLYQISHEVLRNREFYILFRSWDWSLSGIIVVFWVKAIIADKSWAYHRSSLRFLDLICELALVFGYSHFIRNELSEEFERMIAANKSQEQPTGYSLLRPVGIVYSVANTLIDRYSSFPSLGILIAML